MMYGKLPANKALPKKNQVRIFPFSFTSCSTFCKEELACLWRMISLRGLSTPWHSGPQVPFVAQRSHTHPPSFKIFFFSLSLGVRVGVYRIVNILIQVITRCTKQARTPLSGRRIRIRRRFLIPRRRVSPRLRSTTTRARKAPAARPRPPAVQPHPPPRPRHRSIHTIWDRLHRRRRVKASKDDTTEKLQSWLQNAPQTRRPTLFPSPASRREIEAKTPQKNRKM